MYLRWIFRSSNEENMEQHRRQISVYRCEFWRLRWSLRANSLIRSGIANTCSGFVCGGLEWGGRLLRVLTVASLKGGQSEEMLCLHAAGSNGMGKYKWGVFVPRLYAKRLWKDLELTLCNPMIKRESCQGRIEIVEYWLILVCQSRKDWSHRVVKDVESWTSWAHA